MAFGIPKIPTITELAKKLPSYSSGPPGAPKPGDQNFIGPVPQSLPSGMYYGAATKTMFQTPNVHGTKPAAPQPTKAGGFDAYKYPDDPTVYGPYQGNPNHAFTSAEQFLHAGGDWNRINVISRPAALTLPSGPVNVDPATGNVVDPGDNGTVPAGLIAEPQDIFSMDDLRQGVNSPTSASAITSFLSELTAERGRLRESLAGLNTPTQAETDLETALGDLRLQAEKLSINAEGAADEIQRRPIAQKFVEGEQNEVFNQANRSLRTMAAQESNLLSRLGIEQTKRQGKIDTATLELAFLDQDSDTFFKAQTALQEEQQTLFAQASSLREDAQNILGTIIDKFQGLDMEDLDPKTQSYLASVAGNAGVPMGLLISGMKIVKDQILFDNQIKQAELIKKLQDSDKSSEPLSPSEIKTLTDLGYKAEPGDTLGDIQGQIPKVPSSALSVDQSKAKQFAVAAYDANKILETINYDPGKIELGIPNWMKSGKRQEFEQASRAFVNATLRRESGATITDDEFKNKYKELIPQAGDGAGVKENKKKAREAAIRSIQEAGGMKPLDDIIDGDFSSVGNTSASKGNTPYLKTLGAITGYGSSKWAQGLDVDLKKGDPVKSPVSGTVIASGKNGGFGLQVKIQGADGREWWLSHFDALGVTPGQKIAAGQVVGKGGNTGTVIPVGGGDGSHVDITVKQNGKYVPPKQIAQILKNIRV